VLRDVKGRGRVSNGSLGGQGERRPLLGGSEDGGGG